MKFISRPLIRPQVTTTKNINSNRKKTNEILVLLSASVEKFIVSRMRDFFVVIIVVVFEVMVGVVVLVMVGVAVVFVTVAARF